MTAQAPLHFYEDGNFTRALDVHVLLYTEARIRNVLHNSVPLYSVLCAVLYHDILSGQWLVDHRYFHWNDYAKRAWSDRLRIWHNLMQSFVVRNTLANRILEFQEYSNWGGWTDHVQCPAMHIWLKKWGCLFVFHLGRQDFFCDFRKQNFVSKNFVAGSLARMRTVPHKVLPERLSLF